MAGRSYPDRAKARPGTTCPIEPASCSRALSSERLASGHGHGPSRRPFDHRSRSQARNQLVLNLARPDVADWLYQVLDRVLSENQVDFVNSNACGPPTRG
jgi:hypothetical protein